MPQKGINKNAYKNASIDMQAKRSPEVRYKLAPLCVVQNPNMYFSKQIVTKYMYVDTII